MKSTGWWTRRELTVQIREQEEIKKKKRGGGGDEMEEEAQYPK